nr:hypothetical protein [Candidatus Sigynarchaeota archaeon]
MEPGHVSQDKKNPAKDIRVPHATRIKFVFCVYIALLMAFGIKMASIFPFIDTEFTSQATTNPLILVIVIAPVAIMLTGRFWVFNIKTRRLVQLCTMCFAYIVSVLLLVETMQYRDFWGMPPVMQLGFFWTYSYHVGVLYFATLVITTLVLSTELFASNINVRYEPKNRVFLFGIIIGGTIWIGTWTFFNAGMFWSLFIDSCVSGTVLVAKLASLVTTLGNLNHLEAGGTLERIKLGNGFNDLFKNGRNGTLHVFKG